MWFAPKDLKLSIDLPVALATYGGELHMILPGSHLQHGVFTPSGEGGQWRFTDMVNQVTSAGPALIEHRGTLTCVFRANSSPSLIMARLDAATNTWRYDWLPFTTPYGPSVAVHDGLLYLAFVANDGSRLVNWVTWDGNSWGTPAVINAVVNPASMAAPALASYRGQLHMLFVDPSEAVLHSVYGGPTVPNQAWLPLGPTGLKSPSGVAALEWNGLLSTFLRSSLDGTVVTAAFDGATWTGPESTGDTVASWAPAAAALDGSLQLIYSAQQDYNHLYQVTGFAGGTGPLTRTALASLDGNASVRTSVPHTSFSGKHPYTVEAWVKLSPDGVTASKPQYIVSSFDGASDHGLFALAVFGGKFAVRAHFKGRKGVHWVRSQTAIEANQWYHVAAVCDGVHTGLFVNGNLENVEMAPHVRHDPWLPVLIGAASDGQSGTTGLLQGTVRWVAFWSVARSVQELSGDLYVMPAPQQGLMALYDFSGAAPADVSGHAQTAAITGALQVKAETYGLALQDGVSGLDCGAGKTLSFAGSQCMSAEAWVFPTGVSHDSYVLWRDGEYSLGLSPSGWFGSAGGNDPVRSSSPPVLNKWTHVAITWAPSGSSGEATLYVNGAAVKQQSSATSKPATSKNTTIGCVAPGASGVKGCIASVRLWNKALSVTELRTAMTQSPIGMDSLAANYDFSTVPILDVTLNNDVPTNIGTPALSGVIEDISAGEAQQLACVVTDVSIPYYPGLPDGPHPVQAATAAPARDVAGLPRAVDEILTPAYAQSLLDTFHRSLPPGTSDAARKQLASSYSAELERLFLLARIDPDQGLGGHRFEWAHRGEHVVLLHHLPSGETVEAGKVGARDFSPLQLWLMQFTLTLICGFANILGIAATGKSLTEKLLEYIVRNPRILGIVGTFIVAGTAFSPELVLKMLSQLWQEKFLLGLLKTVAKNVGWGAFGWVAFRLLSLLAPFAQEVQVTTMLVNLAVLSIQLSLLVRSYPG